ncbi:hypothetical protein [Desulfovibrio sp.]|uniref:hypothetical protein n=1 Tax=Desulfovibrio sp. TaxID=885 RepID=UPI0025BA39AF|nr:hypothetical protein [Desulfovibrio sp.]
MACHYSSIRSTAPSSMQAGNSGRHTPDSVNLDAFVSNVYLPHVKLRKRSWRVDQRIARQYLSPAFGARKLADIQRHEVEDWLHGLSEKDLASATCNRILAVFKTICSLAAMRGLLPAGQSRARACLPSKSTRNGSAISRGMRRNGSCERWKKATVRKSLPSACFC